MPFRQHFLQSVAFTASVAAFASPAKANHFAPDGSFLFESDAIYAEGFEQTLPSLDADYEMLAVPDALEGSKVFACEALYQSVDLSFPLPKSPAVYETTIWLRGDGLVGVAISYDDGAAGDFSQLFPTGRMTSDGWMEFRSAPITVDGARGAHPLLFFFGQVEADAFEVHASDAMAFAPPQRCEGLADPTCTGDRFCLSGWCRNPQGWVPPIPPDRAQMAAYLKNRLSFFFGPYLNRDRYLDASLAEAEAMADAPSRWRFWNGFATAIRRLRDSHSSVSSLSAYLLENPRPLNACFTIGEADLSQDLAPSHDSLPDLLISHTGETHNWGFSPGDRLVAVDGQHPILWMHSLIAHDWTFSAANDPASVAMDAERLRSAIPRYAHTITVIHCGTHSCSEPEEVDVLAVPEVDMDEVHGIVDCDHRPRLLVESQPENHSLGVDAVSGLVTSAEPEEKIYGLVWDLLISGSSGDASVESAVQQWRQDARGVVLDHRKGNGGSGPQGSTSIADPILAFVKPPTLFGVMPFRQAADEEGPATLSEGLDLVEAYQNTSLAWRGGGTSPRSDVPVALLITRDVSFSDLFPYAFKGAERVRIFGPNPTNGAFSTFFGMGYWYGFNYQLAAGDTIGADGLSLSGRGVTPDQVVFPRQSDLVAGTDTLVAEALSWIRSELEP